MKGTWRKRATIFLATGALALGVTACPDDDGGTTDDTIEDDTGGTDDTGTTGEEDPTLDEGTEDDA